MRQMYKEHRILLFASVAFSIVSSSAISFIGIALKNETNWAKIPISLAFWLGLLGEQICFALANSRLKKMLPYINCRVKPKIGLLAPFNTGVGTIADLVFAVSFIAFLILVIFNIGKDTVRFILLFLLVLSFRMHCILNGKNFWYSNLLLRRVKKHD